VLTRFAPAPTGWLHLGHVLNAEYVWGSGARVLLRIEDHDRDRSRPEYEAGIYQDLEWLGYRPDIIAGRQSDRDDVYREAIEILRVKQGKKIQDLGERTATEGTVQAYIHAGAKLGVLIEVNCETDFVAKTDAFQELVRDLAMQVAAANPTYVAREDVPGEVLEKEREIYRSQLAEQKKPPQVVDKIVEGKLEKFFSEQCLLEQPFIKDASGKTKVKDLVDRVNAATKEKVGVRRFARFQVGGGG